MSDTIVAILAHKRIVGIHILLETLSRCQTKDQSVVHIVSAHNEFSQFYKQCVDLITKYQTKLKIKLSRRLDLKGTAFLDSVKYITNLQSEYTLRLDDDLVMSPQLIDYMINNRHILNNDKNLCMSGLGSNGTATFDYFIEDFCTEQEKQNIFSHLDGYKFPTRFPDGLKDYSVLNPCTNPKWNPQKYHEIMQSLNFRYHPMHPIRTHFPPIHATNVCVLNNFDKLWNPPQMSIQTDKPKYHCNGHMLVKTSLWKSIVEDKSLFSDGYDEKAINRYRIKTDSNILLIRNGFYMHPGYNSIQGSIKIDGVGNLHADRYEIHILQQCLNKILETT